MPSAEDSITIIDSAARIWKALADFGNWTRFATFRIGRRHVLQREFRLVSGAEAASVVGLYQDGSLIQTWGVDAWEPPTRLALSSRDGGMFGLKSSIDFTLEASASTQTKVTVRLGAEFPPSRVFWPLYAVLGLRVRDSLRTTAAGIARGLPHILEDAP